jgi:zinc transporter ZupT
VICFGIGVAVAAAMDRFIPHEHAGGHHEHLGHAPGHDVHDVRDLGATRRAYAVVGALIYVTSNEIIPESHSHGHEGTASAGLVLGFLLTMVLEAVLH